jgi:Tfp pilus assembly protein PilO
VTSSARGLPLLRRIVGEHRRIIVPLGVAVVVNVLAYALVVYPLSQRVANIEERDRASERALAAARQEHRQASGTLTGKDQAAKELAIFYTEVLPQDLTAARRLTHLRLAQLARQANLFYGHVSTKEEPLTRGSTLTRLGIEMKLAGSYADMRTFIHELESSSDFLVIDDLELTEGTAERGMLEVTLRLSTYYRTTAS